MESQTIQELEALTPVEMDAGLVSAVCRPGTRFGAIRIAACIPLPLTRTTAFTNRQGMPPSGS